MHDIGHILQKSTEYVLPHHYTSCPLPYRFPSAAVWELGLEVA